MVGFVIHRFAMPTPEPYVDRNVLAALEATKTIDVIDLGDQRGEHDDHLRVSVSREDPRFQELSRLFKSAVNAGLQRRPTAPYLESQWKFICKETASGRTIVIVTRLDTLEIDGAYYPFDDHMKLDAIVRDFK